MAWYGAPWVMFITPTEYLTLSKISQIFAPQMHNGLSDATPLATNTAQWAKVLSLVLPLLSFGLQQGDQRITIAKSSLCQPVICVFFYKHLFRWQLLERGNLPNHCRSAVFNIIIKKSSSHLLKGPREWFQSIESADEEEKVMEKVWLSTGGSSKTSSECHDSVLN